MNKLRDRGSDVVRRAARAGAGAGPSDRWRRGQGRFLSLVAGVIVAGSMTVGFAWAQRQYDHPTVLDSWQNAYGVYDCTTDGWLEPFDSSTNASGIRSRADGLIYIEPADESVAGDNARLRVFLDAMGVGLSDTTLTLPDGSTLSESGAVCAGEEAVLQVVRWDRVDSTAPAEVRLTELADAAFLDDGQVLTIALAPANASIDMPPSSSTPAFVTRFANSENPA